MWTCYLPPFCCPWYCSSCSVPNQPTTYLCSLSIILVSIAGLSKHFLLQVCRVTGDYEYWHYLCDGVDDRSAEGGLLFNIQK
jgi:hypothetical protein